MRASLVCLSIAFGSFALAVCSAYNPAAAQEYPAGQEPDAQGYVDAIHSDSAFDIIEALQAQAGVDPPQAHIVITPQTVFWKPIVDQGRQAFTNDSSVAKKLAVGDQVQVFGKRIKRTNEIQASTIVLQPKYERLTGNAVIERVIATSPQLILEADGYYIATTPKTVVQYRPPLAKSSPPSPNLWIEYDGRWNRDGLVEVDRITYSQFDPSKRTETGLQRSKQKLVPPVYGTSDGAAGKPGKFMAQYLIGRGNSASIPADRVMQEVVQRVGQSLIPACQKNLPQNDPQKINFQFYVVDDKDLFQAMGSPHGIVIIPSQVVSDMQTDDQIAAVLAQGVAEALEWQVLPKAHNPAGPELMDLANIPNMSPLPAAVLMSVGLYMELHGNYPSHFDPYQTTRVSLSLMHDAGYDVMQAPFAWKLLGLEQAQGFGINPATVGKTYLELIIQQEYSHDQHAVATWSSGPQGN